MKKRLPAPQRLSTKDVEKALASLEAKGLVAQVNGRWRAIPKALVESAKTKRSSS
jgi:hypothetical protein